MNKNDVAITIESLTPRQRDAVVLLAEHPEADWSPAGFAYKFWPGKHWARGNGAHGLGPDASGRHGGRMLTRLERLGLVRFRDHEYNWSALATPLGLKLGNEELRRRG